MDALADIEQAAGPYPTRLLEREHTALLLFGAGFLGVNDGIHIRDAGMYATVVDTDEQKLAEMRELYPATWTWVVDDAFEYAVRARDKSFDIVSVDSWTGDLSARSLDMVGKFVRIASRGVVLTVSRDDVLRIAGRIELPPGWRSWLMPRTPRAMWLVMEHK